MALTSAQRQAALRKRRQSQAVGAENGEGAYRINTFIKASAANALSRMARHHDITQREMLERVLKDAEDALTVGWSDSQIDRHYRP